MLAMMRNPGQYVNRYLFAGDEGMDGNPKHAPKLCWSASYINEAAVGTTAKYPLPPHVSRDFPREGVVPFVEIMINTPRRPPRQYRQEIPYGPNSQGRQAPYLCGMSTHHCSNMLQRRNRACNPTNHVIHITFRHSSLLASYHIATCYR